MRSPLPSLSGLRRLIAPNRTPTLSPGRSAQVVPGNFTRSEFAQIDAKRERQVSNTTPFKRRIPITTPAQAGGSLLVSLIVQDPTSSEPGVSNTTPASTGGNLPVVHSLRLTLRGNGRFRIPLHSNGGFRLPLPPKPGEPYSSVLSLRIPLRVKPGEPYSSVLSFRIPPRVTGGTLLVSLISSGSHFE